MQETTQHNVGTQKTIWNIAIYYFDVNVTLRVHRTLDGFSNDFQFRIGFYELLQAVITKMTIYSGLVQAALNEFIVAVFYEA